MLRFSRPTDDPSGSRLSHTAITPLRSGAGSCNAVSASITQRRPFPARRRSENSVPSIRQASNRNFLGLPRFPHSFLFQVPCRGLDASYMLDLFVLVPE